MGIYTRSLPQKYFVKALASYLRLTPFHIGTWRLKELSLPILRSLGDTMGKETVKTRHGFQIRVSPGEWIGSLIYLTGSYEPGVTNAMRCLLKPGDVFVDIGANIGFFTLFASVMVGEEGKVLAVEPVPTIVSELKHNIAINRLQNIQLYDCALADQEGEVIVYEGSSRNSGVSGFRDFPGSVNAIRVKTRRFDDIAKNHSIRLIKLDVEGSEQLVLQGMVEYLTRVHPDLIIEVSDRFLRELGSSAQELVEFLKKMGYHMFMIKHDGLVPTEGIPTDFQFNALFTTSACSETIRGLVRN